ncbi:uncharacterized protein C8Q71DRAFT_761776 [Rhodofomes roseus]|nr:uncharacterized protein C8Q71DRAFT_761776 [Rhodofomes roseus]KAH9836307.1 hypothetical protein C8Q71DRAFT_761776 [Rhodofomes roseus]
MSPVSPHVPSQKRSLQTLYPRKGSGGHSSGGGKSGGKSGEGGGGSSSTGTTKSVPISGSTGGRTNAQAYGSGGIAASTIPSGQLFAGRSLGGGTRNQVFGSRVYGSGYPGLGAGSVAGRGFPFLFWPVVWGAYPGFGAHYLHSGEYGRPDNTSRPGGALVDATFSSNSTNSTFFIVGDNSTVASLIDSISGNCTLASNSSTTPSPYNATSSEPKPEQAVQYYRASSVALLLDGYNNTVALGNDTNATAVPLPSWVDMTLLNCLNDTIAQAAPLFSGAQGRLYAPNFGGLVALVFVIWRLFRI